MKNIKIKTHFFNYGGALLLLLLLSCEKLEVDTSDHLLSGETVFSDTKTVEAAILALYAKLRDDALLTGSVKGLSNILGNYADEITYVSPYGLGDEPFYRNALNPNNESIEELWDKAYNIIYGANAIIEGVADSRYFTDAERDEFTGEALFVRALLHFYLVNLYGDIPYVTTTNYLVNMEIGKMTQPEIYEHIAADLLMASELLPETEGSGENLRPSKNVAKALSARSYLYMEQWALAESQATEVIGTHAWESELLNVFKNTSLSTLWQFSPNFSGDPTLEAETFIVQFAPPSERMLNPSVVASFETGDLRRDLWIGEVSDDTQSYYFPYKYKIGLGQNNTEEYSIAFRMAEIFLIRAEARTQMGNLTGAREDLDKIRLRAGLPNISANTQNELLGAILHERRIEFFAEHGHRFFDLKRTGNLDAMLNAKPGWNTTDRLFPLPEKELLLNPNLLPQNPGY